MSRKSGTSGGNSFLSYAGKRLIDLGVDYVKNKNKAIKGTTPTSPLEVHNLGLAELPFIGLMTSFCFKRKIFRLSR